MPSIKHFKSFRSLRNRTNSLLQNSSEVILKRLEKFMLMCNGYNKIKPIILSKGVSTMLPQNIALDEEHGNAQFRPHLGSTKRVKVQPVNIKREEEIKTNQSSVINRPIKSSKTNTIRYFESLSASNNDIHIAEHQYVVMTQDMQPNLCRLRRRRLIRQSTAPAFY